MPLAAAMLLRVVSGGDDEKRVGQRGKRGRKKEVKRPLTRRCADRLIEAGAKFHLGRDELREREAGVGWMMHGEGVFECSALETLYRVTYCSYSHRRSSRNFSRSILCSLFCFIYTYVYVSLSLSTITTLSIVAPLLPPQPGRFMRPAFFSPPASWLAGWLDSFRAS